MTQSIIFSVGEEVTEWQWQVFWKIHPVPILEQGQRNTQLALVWKTSGKIRTPGGGHLDRGYNEQLRHRWGPWNMHKAYNEWAWTNQWKYGKRVAWAQQVANKNWRWCVASRKLKHYLMSRILEKQPEFPLAVIPFPLTPRVCEPSSSPLINTSRSSRIKIYSHIFIYTCSSCSYNIVVFKVGGTTPGGAIRTFRRAMASKQSDGGRWNCEGGVGAITVKCDVGVGRKAGKTGPFN